MSFATWMENAQNIQTTLNLRKNQNDVLTAFEVMEGEWVLEGDGPYTVKGAIEWLKKISENNEGDFIVYGGGGVNRYFVYPNGDVVFSEYHAKHPQEKTIKKAQELGFKTE